MRIGVAESAQVPKKWWHKPLASCHVILLPCDQTVGVVLAQRQAVGQIAHTVEDHMPLGAGIKVALARSVRIRQRHGPEQGRARWKRTGTVECRVRGHSRTISEQRGNPKRT